jgi:hypothetical protein
VDVNSLYDETVLNVGRAKAGTLPADQVAATYAAIQALRAQADRFERDLIRSLRWDAAGNVVRTWAEVAEVVQAQLGSRQAAHARWGRLKSPARRTTTGDSRRGAARPRHQRKDDIEG